MKPKSSRQTQSALTEVIIPKEKAVFWMDAQGRWHNRHGRFEHKRIIDHFNRSIRRDKDGYFVTQIRGDFLERVYFHYDDTPLFVVGLIDGDPMKLVLNTRQTIPLDPSRLFIQSDQLYLQRSGERIKFGERVLLPLSRHMDETENGLVIRINGQINPIPEY